MQWELQETCISSAVSGGYWCARRRQRQKQGMARKVLRWNLVRANLMEGQRALQLPVAGLHLRTGVADDALRDEAARQKLG